MRIFIALFSLLLLLVSLFHLLNGQDVSILQTKKDRTWGRFILSLFTGELLYEYYNSDKPNPDIIHNNNLSEASQPILSPTVTNESSASTSTSTKES